MQNFSSSIRKSLLLTNFALKDKQLSLLKGDHKKLKATIKKFAQDELEHHDIGIAHDAEKTPGYTILTKFIEMGCKTAIAISKKI